MYQCTGFYYHTRTQHYSHYYTLWTLYCYNKHACSFSMSCLKMRPIWVHMYIIMHALTIAVLSQSSSCADMHLTLTTHSTLTHTLHIHTHTLTHATHTCTHTHALTHAHTHTSLQASHTLHITHTLTHSHTHSCTLTHTRVTLTHHSVIHTLCTHTVAAG